MKSVLFIEDDDSIGKLYITELASEGYEVIVEGDPELALNRIRTQRPSLIVLDIMLPGVDGLTVLEKIRRLDRSLPIIISTAYSAYKGSLSVWSADDIVIKSSDLSELKEKIKKHLKT